MENDESGDSHILKLNLDRFFSRGLKFLLNVMYNFKNWIKSWSTSKKRYLSEGKKQFSQKNNWKYRVFFPHNSDKYCSCEPVKYISLYVCGRNKGSSNNKQIHNIEK